MAYRHTRRAFRGMGQTATPCGQPGQPSCAGNQPNDYQKSIGIVGFTDSGMPIFSSQAAATAEGAVPGSGYQVAAGGSPASMSATATTSNGIVARPIPAQPFSASLPAPSATAPTTTPATPVQPTGFVEPVPPAAPTTNGFSLTMPILGFPLWLWGAAAIGAFFLFSGGQHHGRY